MLDYDSLLEQALHVIPTHRETHGIKGTFAVMRLSRTYPHWSEDVLRGALALIQNVSNAAKVEGLAFRNLQIPDSKERVPKAR